MEQNSSPVCPRTVTIRRNPHRRARPTPLSAIPLREPLSIPPDIPSFPVEDIQSIELPKNPPPSDDAEIRPVLENLKLYLRIRPLKVEKTSANSRNARLGAETKNAWPKVSKSKSSSRNRVKKSSEICLQVNDDLQSITMSPPQVLQETKKAKCEVFEGFSRVFVPEASQNEVYERMVEPLVEDFLRGKSGMLAAMGPSGSGKTHTVFGCAREPGMVPLALNRIFSHSQNDNNEAEISRKFYLSMFEITSDKGKTEKIIDLLNDGNDTYMQQYVLKGLKEVLVSAVQQAESLIAQGMLKRATAMTNSNFQSSRSQCIINLRFVSEKVDGKFDEHKIGAVLTIVDLAGAEREKKTGNQGARLLESNFINNTSMVFGLCLRSLLEHQRNPKRPLRKHFQGSLLTKYLRDYLEGKKRMALILTAKPGDEDYSDTLFLLRQASPFTKIDFKNIEEPISLNANKRPLQTLPRAEQLKRIKSGRGDTYAANEGKIDRSHQLTLEENPSGVVKERIHPKIEDIDDGSLTEIEVRSEGFVNFKANAELSWKEGYTELSSARRKQQVMQGFAKALWKVLKEYKSKLEGAESEILNLKSGLLSEKNRCSNLENELKELKSKCTCWNGALSKFSSLEFNDDRVNSLSDSTGVVEVRSSEESIAIEAGVEGCCEESLSESIDHTESFEDFKDMNLVDMDSASEATCKLTITSPFTDHMSDDCTVNTSITSIAEHINNLDQNVVRDMNPSSEKIPVSSLSSSADRTEIPNNSQDCSYQKDSQGENSQIEGSAKVSSLVSPVSADSSSLFRDDCLLTSEDAGGASGHPISKSLLGSCESLKDESSSVEETRQNEDSKIDPITTVLPKEHEACTAVEALDSGNVPKSVNRQASSHQSQNAEKPKRRLLPASSVLLKDMSALDIKDETSKPKAGRKGKKLEEDGDYRTQGSSSLLNLLRRNMVR